MIDPLSMLDEPELFEHTVVNHVQRRFGCCGYMTIGEYRSARREAGLGGHVRSEPESCDLAKNMPENYLNFGYPTLGCRFAIDQQYGQYRQKMMVIISFTIFFTGFAALASLFMLCYFGRPRTNRFC